jgi:hypothetical protein
VPEWLSDDGVLTDEAALPVAELLFGGLEFDSQAAQFRLGPLTCSGRKVIARKVAPPKYYRIQQKTSHCECSSCLCIFFTLFFAWFLTYLTCHLKGSSSLEKPALILP